tara:strand:+ start:275 stop:901 length:627 start_codon:yes stop_codon:yes gene_type:complete
MKVNKHIYDIDKLIQDKDLVEKLFRYEDGWGGHSISLPDKSQARNYHQRGKGNKVNKPYNNILNKTLYFKEIYDSFETKVAGFRLMKRKAHSSYGVHTDEPIVGNNILRFQIPIVVNDDCWLCITDQDWSVFETGDWWSDNSYGLEDFKEVTKNKCFCYQQIPGNLYHFDVTQLHIVINEGNNDRVVLLIDLYKNKWLNDWVEKTFYE